MSSISRASHAGWKAVGFLVVGLSSSCASLQTKSTSAPGFLSAAALQARRAEAEALAAKGCYVCLLEAGSAYVELLKLSDSPSLIHEALENDLMIAIRERQLRLPDSGAAARAQQLRTRTTSNYEPYFQALDVIDKPLVMGGTITMEEFRRQQAERRTLSEQLELNWPSSAMAAYFYVAIAVSAGQLATLKPQLQPILNTHGENLSVKYLLQTYPSTATDTASAELLTQDRRWAEVHYALAERAIFGAALVKAHAELTEARQGLPDSLTITLTFGRVELAFARYQQALNLFDRVLERGPDAGAQLGRAIALSYLKRREDAIDVLNDLLKDPSTYPGDKYYWRGWNHLALGEAQAAYDDARAAMNSMANSDVFKLAGMASYNLAHTMEARGYFESSLKINSAECDSIRYLGLVDSAERSWRSAADRFKTAADCYQAGIQKMESDLAEKQADNSGLYGGQIAGIIADIADAKALMEASIHNAEVSRRNAVQPSVSPVSR